jgi:hypothetical protein
MAKTPTAEPHTISTPTRATVNTGPKKFTFSQWRSAHPGSSVKEAAASYAKLPSAQRMSAFPKTTATKKAKVTAKTTKSSSGGSSSGGSSSGGSSSGGSSAGSSAGSNLYGGDLVSQILGISSTSPQAEANAALSSLQNQTQWQNTQMQNAANAAENAASNWSNQSAANLTNLAHLTGTVGTTNDSGLTAAGDLPANIRALPGVMSQQELLKSVASAAQSENQAGNIPGYIAATATDAQGRLYGAEAKAQSAILDALAKNNATMTGHQLAAASRILAAQISAGGAIQRQQMSDQTGLTKAQISASTSSLKISAANAKATSAANAKELAAARTAAANLWNGQAASGSKNAIPPSRDPVAMYQHLSSYNLSDAQKLAIVSSFGFSNEQIMNLQATIPSLRRFGGYQSRYNAAVKIANAYKTVVAKDESQRASLTAQINALQNQINATAPADFAGKASLVVQQQKLREKLKTLGSISPAAIASNFTKMADIAGGRAAEILLVQAGIPQSQINALFGPKGPYAALARQYFT